VSAETVACKLGDRKSDAICRCPAHALPSLSITDAPYGRSTPWRGNAGLTESRNAKEKDNDE
jgi:hypothetical protein